MTDTRERLARAVRTELTRVAAISCVRDGFCPSGDCPCATRVVDAILAELREPSPEFLRQTREIPSPSGGTLFTTEMGIVAVWQAGIDLIREGKV